LGILKSLKDIQCLAKYDCYLFGFV
jgi:hypothetical protein